ncbi:uncharacterized protein V6R79_007201 [Siganus canaliculatus]
MQTLCEKCYKSSLKRIKENGFYTDNRLFYTGPNKNYMRLVVLSEEEKTAILSECHNQPGTGNHNGIRGTRNRVVAGYYWPTITKDVTDWIRCCHQCQLNDPMKTVAPVLHPIKVKENWSVLGMDLIGPLKETARGNKYVLTMTDLFSKFVVAEPLQSKSAVEVSAAITSKFYMFGMVSKVITDQGREFVNESKSNFVVLLLYTYLQLNKEIFTLLNIKHAIASAYHPQTNGQDERTNQNVKRALRHYVNEHHNDWDIHLQAVVYGINTAKQSSTKNTPFFLFFHRHHLLPEVLNTCPMGDQFEVGDPEEDLEERMRTIAELNEKVLGNIEKAQEKQKKTFAVRKRKRCKTAEISTGDEVLLSSDPKKQRLQHGLKPMHQGPFKVLCMSEKGVATIQKNRSLQKVNVNRLRPYYRQKNTSPKSKSCGQREHPYALSGPQQEHPYAVSGPKWEKYLGPLQDELLKYVLDRNRSAGEFIVKDGKTCLTREDFWSLGWRQCLESNTLLDDAKSAAVWLSSNTKLLRGKVAEPSILSEDTIEQQRILESIALSDDTASMDPLLFVFDFYEDMDLFCNVADKKNLRICCMFLGRWDDDAMQDPIRESG